MIFDLQKAKRFLIDNFLCLILFCTFFLLYFTLSFNNRLAADDFYFLKNLNDHGWWQSMVLSWHSWVTRWSSVLWLNVVFFSYKLTGSFLVYHLVTLVALFFAIERILLSASSYLHQPQVSGFRFQVSLFVVSFFFLAGSIGETFFWITSTAMYLSSFIALCFLISEVIKEKVNFLSAFICIVFSAFIGGAAEAISISGFFILALILFFQVREKKKSWLSLLSILILLVSIIISYAGEGRLLRQSALPHTSTIDAMLIPIKSIAQMEIYFLKEKVLWAILFFLAWMGFAERVSIYRRFKSDIILKILVWYVALSFVFLFPTCYLLGEIPPFRAWILVSFLNCCCLVLCGIVFSNHTSLKPELAKVISNSALIILSLLITKTAIEQRRITKEYAHAVDARIEVLESANPNEGKEIVLDKLPESGLLLSSEISSDTSDFRNRHLQSYYGLKGGLKIK